MGQRMSHVLGLILIFKDRRLVLQRFLALNPDLPIPVSALSDPELMSEEVGHLSVREKHLSYFFLPGRVDRYTPTLLLARTQNKDNRLLQFFLEKRRKPLPVILFSLGYHFADLILLLLPPREAQAKACRVPGDKPMMRNVDLGNLLRTTSESGGRVP